MVVLSTTLATCSAMSRPPLISVQALQSRPPGKAQVTATVHATAHRGPGQWKQLGDLCQEEATLLLVSGSFMVAAAIAEASLPHFTSLALHAATVGEDKFALTRAVRRMFTVGLLSAVFTGLRGCAFWIAGARVLRSLKVKVFASVLKKPASFFDVNDSGALGSRLSSDTSKISDVVSFNLNIIARQTIQAIVSLCWLASIHRGLTALFFGFLALSFAANQRYSLVNRRLSKATQRAVSDANVVATEGFRLSRTIKVHATEREEAARYARCCARVEDLQERSGKVYGVARLVNGAATAFLSAIVLLVGARLRLSGIITGQQLTTYILSASTVTSASVGIGEQWVKVQEALGAAEEVLSILEEEETDVQEAASKRSSVPAIVNATCEGHTSPFAIDMRGVTFAYPSRPEAAVLRGFDMQVPRGQMAALVGVSGSGKSSVVRLLCGLYQADGGSVRLDGREVEEMSRRDLSRKVAWLPQEPQLFTGTIAQNIAYGLEEGSYTMEDIRRVAKLANVDSFVDSLGGYNAPVGEGGSSLSGGQRQRVAVARALMRGAQVFLLDEPTSALDVTAERLVEDAATQLVRSGGTCLIVAHRLQTIQQADIIFVMRDGRVVETGTHSELIQLGGNYAAMVEESTKTPRDLTIAV